MPALVKNTINLFRTSRKADPVVVDPPDPLVFPSTPVLPPVPAPPPVRRYSPKPKARDFGAAVLPSAAPLPTLPPASASNPMPPKPKSRHSSAPVNYAAHGGGAADMTPSTQAKGKDERARLPTHTQSCRGSTALRTRYTRSPWVSSGHTPLVSHVLGGWTARSHPPSTHSPTVTLLTTSFTGGAEAPFGTQLFRAR